MGEQGAKAAGLEWPVQSRFEQLPRCIIVDGGGEECLAHGLAADTNQPLERLVFLLGCRGHVALARELHLPQYRGRAQKPLHVAAMLSDQPVHRARRRRRFAQRLHAFRCSHLPELPQPRAVSSRAA